MKLLVLYRPLSEHATAVEDYVNNFRRDYPDKELELMDVDSIDGSNKAQLYDVVRYPAFLALDSAGSLLNMWSGSDLPLVGEVAGYLNS